MAKVSGRPKISGAFGEVVFVELGEQTYIRGRVKTNKEVIYNAPSREKQRETMSEFGFASQCAQLIRNGWRISEQCAAGPNTSGRVTKAVLDILDRTSGKKSQRPILFTQFGQSLIGFEHGENRNPTKHFSQEPQITLDQTPEGFSVKLKFPPKTRQKAKLAHPMATHYAAELSVILLSDMYPQPDSKDWIFEEKDFKPQEWNYTSAKIPLGKHPDANTEINMQAAVPAGKGQIIIISWGIQYFQQQGSLFQCIRIEKPRSTIRQHDTYMVVHAVEPRIFSEMESEELKEIH